MIGARVVGGAVLALAGVLLYGHWRRQQELVAAPPKRPQDARFAWQQLRRRMRGSALMAFIGGAILLAERVPKSATALSLYLFGLLAATLGLAAYGLVDWRATQAWRHQESLETLRQHLADQIDKFADEQQSESSADEPSGSAKS